MKDRKGWIKVAMFVGTSEPELVDAPKTGSSMVRGAFQMAVKWRTRTCLKVLLHGV